MNSTGERANGAARRGAGRSGMARSGVGLRDVAQAVGVSTATVSRAINRPEVVRRGTLRERIAAAIAELGWIPDGAARALTTGRSQTIGAVFPTLGLGDFPRAANAIQRHLLGQDYTLLLACSEYDPEQSSGRSANLPSAGSTE